MCVEYVLCPGGIRLEHFSKLLKAAKRICIFFFFFVNQQTQPRNFVFDGWQDKKRDLA